MIKIMFVCHGNICRSPMAEFYMKHIVEKSGLSDNFQIDSTATSLEEIGNDIHYGTRRMLDKHNIPYEKRSARRFTKSDYQSYDYVLIMDKNNLKNILRIIGEDCDNKIELLLKYTGEEKSIADPWYTGGFDETYYDVSRGCNAFFKYLKDNVLQLMQDVPC